MSEVNPLQTLRQRVSSAVEQLFADYVLREYRRSKIIRDVIWGFINILPHELALLDSPLFQRLRRVYQTSLALLTYPCSVHTRFEHSLGSLAIADRVIESLKRNIEVTEIERLEIRLAALIHDWTHGPLSHTSESFYKSAPIFEAIKTYYPSLFRRASASEILTYCVITCDAFGEIWGELIERYARFPNDSLRRCDRWRIASMIVGSDNNAERPASSPQPFLRQLIHGPFDVDKLDYIARDGYFTGLSLPVDVERLLWVLETIKIGTGSDSQQFLCVSASGATVLEQVLFSKMHLFSSVYHHHKVRVAHQAALRLLSLLEEALVEINGLSLSNPETFLCLDDYDLLHGCFEINDKEKSEAAHALATAIKNRSLPRRALVLTHPAWGNDPSVGSDYDRQAWFNAMKSDDQPNRLVAQIAEKAGIDLTDIWVDIPDPVNLQGTGQEGMIKFDAKTFMPIQEMFPVGGWLSAYQSYRATSYIFSWRNQGKVGCVAREILRKEYGVTTNDVALKLAKLESED